MADQSGTYMPVSQLLIEAIQFVGDLQALQDKNSLNLGQNDLDTIQDYLADIAALLGIDLPSEEDQ